MRSVYVYADFVSGACSVVTRLSSRTGITAARKKVRVLVTVCIQKRHNSMTLSFSITLEASGRTYSLSSP